MDPQKASKTKPQRRGKLTKSRAIHSSNESSSDEKSDEDQNLGSRLKLLRDKRKSVKKRHSNVTSDPEESENTIVQIEAAKPTPPVQKESSIAQSIKRRLGFFRRSESTKSTQDVEVGAATAKDIVETPESEKKQTMDVVVDVHCENESLNSARVIKKSVSSRSSDETKKSDNESRRSSPEDTIEKSLDLIEEFQEEQTKKSAKNGFFDEDKDESDSESSANELTSELPPTSGGESSSRQRKRWEKTATAELVVENLSAEKKPRRKQWAKGTASAEIRNITGQKIVVPKRSATADPGKLTRLQTSRSTKPVAAPRSKSLQKEEPQRGFDNDGFSSDHDEVLRIETVNDQSPKIKMGSASAEIIDAGASTLSEEEEKVIPASRKLSNRKPSIEEVKDYLQATVESTENSDTRDRSPSETNESPDFMERKNISRRRPSTKRKSSVDKRSIRSLDDDDEEDEVDDDDEEQETVLNVMEKKSRRSSSSSKVEIIPTNFFEKESSDETTISTNEEMHTSRKDSQQSRRSRSKSKLPRRERSDADNASQQSSRTRRKTTSSSTRSAEEVSTARRKTKSRTKKQHKKKEKKLLEDVEEEIKYISVKVHRADMVEADYITRHPMVKVHIVNVDTGEYLKMKNKDHADDGLLQPIITGKFDFKEKKSMVPIWEEELIFEHDFKDLVIEGKGAALVLFEIVDLLTFTEASVSYDQFGRESCWYKVAWAFLRPVGTSVTQHVDKKVRLQLYRPRKTFRKVIKNKCEVYKWWKSNSRDKYPSSLYVTISAVDPPKLEPVLYEQLLQLNDLSEIRSDSQNLLSPKAVEEASDRPKWTRLAAQSCQIPNEMYIETEASDNGCFYLAFSHDGKYLACALSEEYDYPILVYKIDEGKIHVRFSGHKNFIYSLSWSQDDRYLLSVSSDRTARLWDVQERIIEPIQSLPHPGYVYCGKFSLDASNYIVTGCYDHVARVWARLRHNNSHQYELIQELEAHESFITAMCFQPKDEMFLTGDGVGVIAVWTIKRSRKSPIKKEWQIARKIKIKEMEGVPINSIALHPLGSRLLVHSRNNGLKLLDLMSGVVVKRFEGLKNQRIQVTACITPCGSLLFCGGEDSTLNVWNVDSGKLLATYEIDSQDKAVTCVDYHPYDHVVAFSTYGAPVPVKILKYDREADGRNVGLKTFVKTISVMSVSSTARMKEQPLMTRNGGRNLEKLSVRSLNSSTNISQFGSISHLPSEFKDDEVRKHLKGKLQRFMESGPTIKAKSMNRLNGIIEKIDKILMYATSQKSPAVDLESARNSSVFAIDDRLSQQPVEAFELQDLPEVHRDRTGKRSKKHRPRSKSARNACSPTVRETEFSKAFSDSAAFNRKVSRFSDDSSNSNRSTVHERFAIERLELEKIHDYGDTESGFKDSLDTIVDGKEDFPSEEILDVESLKSDDTYVVHKDKKSSGSEGNDSSERSNATFVIESEVPIPKPRRRVGRIEVM